MMEINYLKQAPFSWCNLRLRSKAPAFAEFEICPNKPQLFLSASDRSRLTPDLSYFINL